MAWQLGQSPGETVLYSIDTVRLDGQSSEYAPLNTGIPSLLM